MSNQLNTDFKNYLNILRDYILFDRESKILLEKLILISETTKDSEYALIKMFAEYNTSNFREYCIPIANYWESLKDQNAIDGIDSAVANCGKFIMNNEPLTSIYLLYETDSWLSAASMRLIGNNVSLPSLIYELKREHTNLTDQDVENLYNLNQTQGHDVNYMIEEISLNEISLD